MKQRLMRKKIREQRGGVSEKRINLAFDDIEDALWDIGKLSDNLSDSLEDYQDVYGSYISRSLKKGISYLNEAGGMLSTVKDLMIDEHGKAIR